MLAYWKFESISLQRRVCKLSVPEREIGMAPIADGTFMSWDGVPGPQRREIGDRIVVAYRNIVYVDYIDMPGTMTAALTARIDAEEYKARILALVIGAWGSAPVGARR